MNGMSFSEPEEVLHSASSSDSPLQRLIGVLESLVTSADFAAFHGNFLHTHAGEMSREGEENSLRSHELFCRYKAQMESFLEAQIRVLDPSLDLAAISAEQVSELEDESDEISELLASLFHFEAFKRMLLEWRRAAEVDLADCLTLSSVGR